ncbi:MAG TPA: dihydrolipoamide acetyltransferase family protein [Anaerolineales bacterium]
MATVIKMPKLGFDMAEGLLVRWVKGVGDSVQKGEVLAEIETDKATIEVESEAGGIVHKHLVPEHTSVPVGAPIAVIGEPGEQVDATELVGQVPGRAAVAKPAATSTEKVAAVVSAGDGDGHLPGGVRASPVARRLAAEGGINLRDLAGSGPQGRIVKRDVQARLGAAGTAVAQRVFETERVPLSKLRATIGRRMTASKQQVPHFYVSADLDAGPLMALRRDLNSRLPEDSKFSVNDFLVKAAALALREFPNLNSALEGDQIVRHGEINIGVAVALEEGLLTVVLRGADRTPLRQLSSELRELVGRARAGRVRPADIEGSTFTVSNLGMFQVDHFLAVINPPEAAILAVGSVREEPVVQAGAIVPGTRLQVTLSADHRVTDGAEAARWLQVFRSYTEAPVHLLV